MRNYLSRVVATVCVLALLPFATALSTPQESEEMQIVRTAEQLVQQQKPDEALAELQKIFDKNDEFAPAYFVAGLAYAGKDQTQEAFDSFVLATEYQLGWGAAHRQASFYAAGLGNLDASWDHAIKAHLAGTDMSDAFEGLQTMGPSPDDFQARLTVYRVMVAPMNLEQYLASEENPFGRMIDAGGSATNTDNISNTRATGVAARVVSQSSADRASVMRRTRQRLADSRYFALVGSQNQAQYILVIEVDELGENSTSRPMRAYFNLLDAQSGERAYRMRVEMRNIASESDINRDLDRIIGLLEEWAEKQQR